MSRSSVLNERLMLKEKIAITIESAIMVSCFFMPIIFYILKVKCMDTKNTDDNHCGWMILVSDPA
jgi:hypothetical protein